VSPTIRLIDAGNRACRVQQYDKAIEEYTAAGLVSSEPLVLYNLGQTLRAAKQYEKAVRQYELFLSRGAPGSALRALVECHVATMKHELEAAASTAPPTGPARRRSSSALRARGDRGGARVVGAGRRDRSRRPCAGVRVPRHALRAAPR
jgi:tetratricopeptide (TPR) repeat protein